MTPDEMHDCRGWLGECAKCGGDVWQGETVGVNDDAPGWAHKDCKGEDDGIQKGQHGERGNTASTDTAP